MKAGSFSLDRFSKRAILVAFAAAFLTACSDEPLAPIAAPSPVVTAPVIAFDVSGARLATLEIAVQDADSRLVESFGEETAQTVSVQLDALSKALESNDATLGANAASALLKALEGVDHPDAEAVRLVVGQILLALPASSEVN